MPRADRPPLVIQPRSPRHLREGFAEEEFAREPVQHIEEAVPVGGHHDFARLALPLQIRQNRDLRGIEIEFVVRRELEMPFQLSRVGIHRDEGTGVEVIARPHIAVPVGARIPDSPIDQVRFRIVRAGGPDGSPAMPPGIAAPAVMARLTRLRNGMEAPDFFPGLRGIRRQIAADSQFSARRSHDDFIFYDQRRGGHGVPFLRPPHFGGPDQVSVTRIESEKIPIDGPHEQRVPQHRETPVDAPAARPRFRGRIMRVRPENSAGHRVQGHHHVRGLHRVENSVGDQRCRFVFAVRLRGSARLQHPLEFQVFHVGGRNLRERAVALTVHASGISKPVLCFLRVQCQGYRKQQSGYSHDLDSLLQGHQIRHHIGNLLLTQLVPEIRHRGLFQHLILPQVVLLQRA